MKVSLRAVEPEDVDFMLKCESAPDASKWSDVRAPLSRNQLLSYALTYDADPFRAGQLRLIIEAADSGTAHSPVGILDLYDISEKDSRAFIGICVHPDFRRKGSALLALRALKDFNRQSLGLRNLLAKVSVENLPALHLFSKAGFKEIALLPRWHRIGTRFHDFHLLSLPESCQD